jgi:hypothetical protein
MPNNYRKRIPDRIFLLPDAFREVRTTSSVHQSGRPTTVALPNFGVDLLKWIRLKLLGNRYHAGDNLYVLATDLGITATKSNGVYTVNIPSDIELIGLDVTGDADDLAADNSVQIVLNWDWDNNANLAKESITYANIDLWEITSTDPDSSANVYRQITSVPPQRRIILAGSNSVTIELRNMNLLLNWAISIQI